MPSKSPLFTLLAVLLTAAGCHCHGVIGSGVEKTDAREVGPYHRVMVDGALAVKLVDRPAGTVQLTGDDNLVDLVETTVTDGVLTVKPKDDVGALMPKVGLDIEVSLQHLSEVGADGASHVTATAPLKCDRVALWAAGASHLELEQLIGTEVVLWASGSSHVTVRDATAPRATFKVTGSSKVEVQAGKLDAIDLEVSGSSVLQLGPSSIQTATLLVSGSSVAELSAAAGVSGTVSGSSKVVVKGNPAERELEASGGSVVTYE